MSDATSITLFGIPNCDTVRKARRWLDGHGIAYRFHDVRTAGVEAATIEGWIARLDGWDALVNRRGTTWRQLAEAAKADLDEARAIALMVAHPTLIRRPVAVRGERVLVGFEEDLWIRLLGG